jgi:hypothetical protein
LVIESREKRRTFIFCDNVLGEDEIWLVGELRKLGKPVSLVRSKIDADIENAIYDGKDEEMIMQRRSYSDTLRVSTMQY